jgi:4-methyl-5(b-hydroxyethyl)-thiazole monophosphate biosynthesis
MAKRAIVFLADGFEEVEAATPIDYLRRAGVEVATVSISQKKQVKGAHGLVFAADTTLAEADLDAANWDAVFIPGGQPGADNLAACAPVGAFYKAMAQAKKICAAICAAPAVVLAPLGILKGKSCTCYPGLEAALAAGGGKFVKDRAVIDGNLVTSRGPGTAAAFALALVEKLAGTEAAHKLIEAALL